jgi:hypothetical protein
MDAPLIIFFITLSIYLPLTWVLLYVWNKFGSKDRGVFIARTVYLIGSAVLFGYMIIL